jgi:hypothetical protein
MGRPLKKAELLPIPGEEPKLNPSDRPIYDRATTTDPPIVERPSAPAMSYRLHPRRPRPFRSPTGEVVYRIRGKKGFTPIYPSWKGAGLIRRSGVVTARAREVEIPKSLALPGMQVRPAPLSECRHPEHNPGQTGINGHGFIAGCRCGRNFFSCLVQKARLSASGRVIARFGTMWTAYPRAWNLAEPGPELHIFLSAAELALKGADLSGSNVPGMREFVERILDAHSRAQADLASLGPRINEPENAGQPAEDEPGSFTRGKTGWSMQARLRLLAIEREEAERKRATARGRVITMERGHRDNDHGAEHGPVVSILRNGRVRFNRKGGIWTHHPWARPRGGVVPRGLRNFSDTARVAHRDGKRRRLTRQQSSIPRRNRPGPKPKYGYSMSVNQRVREFRQRLRMQKTSV